MVNGIVRRLDELGRITIPAEIRHRFGIEDGDRFGISLDGNTIKLSVFVKGMSRPVDNLGRVVIPMEIRKVMNFKDGELVDIWVEDGKICVKKFALQCVICGSEDEQNLMDIDEVKVCRKRAVKVISKFSEE